MSRLAGVREVAIRDRKLTFTALMHQITPELLVTSFYQLKATHATSPDSGVARPRPSWPCKLLFGARQHYAGVGVSSTVGETMVQAATKAQSAYVCKLELVRPVGYV